LSRERKCQNEPARAGAHCGNVAGGAGEGFIADRLGRVNIRQKVHAFKERIAGDDKMRAGVRRDNGSIIADAELDTAKAVLVKLMRDVPGEAANQLTFCVHPDLLDS